MGAVPGNFGGGDFQGVPSGFLQSSSSITDVSVFLRPPPEEPEEAQQLVVYDADLEVSPPSTDSTTNAPQSPRPTPIVEEEGQVLFRLAAPGGVVESKEEKERDPGETLRTPPLKLGPCRSISVSPERRFAPYVTQSPRTPTPPRTPTSVVEFPVDAPMEDPPISNEPRQDQSDGMSGPPWLDAWSTEVDWQVKQQGQTLAEHGVILEGQGQGLASIGLEVGNLRQIVQQIPHEIRGHFLQAVQDQRAVVAHVGALKLEVGTIKEKVPEIVQREIVAQVGGSLDFLRTGLGESCLKIEALEAKLASAHPPAAHLSPSAVRLIVGERVGELALDLQCKGRESEAAMLGKCQELESWIHTVESQGERNNQQIMSQKQRCQEVENRVQARFQEVESRVQGRLQAIENWVQGEVPRVVKPPAKVEAPGSATTVDSGMEARLWSKFEQRFQEMQKENRDLKEEVGRLREQQKRTQGEIQGIGLWMSKFTGHQKDQEQRVQL
ncbi:hypothetical protein M569_13622, partial [Genlisea aurea]